MPCNSEYLEPTQRERELQRAARLYSYVLIAMGVTPTDEVVRAANDQYCATDLVPMLCALIHSMTPNRREKIVYDAHSKEARDLAEWWEEHQAADRQREAREADAAAQATLREQALAKLTPAERKALGV